MFSGRLLPTLYLVSVVAAVAVLAPLLPGLIGVGPGYLLYRDAVSTPRTHVTDTTLGIGDLPPRAVPQDWFVAMASTVVDGGAAVTAILLAALVFAGVGFGRLAFRLVPGAGRAGAVAAVLVAIWNPYVAERLLQGHWSLLVGYAALGWLLVAVVDLRDRPGPVRFLQLGGLLAAAGLTPTGSVLAGIVLAVALIGRPVGLRSTIVVVLLWILSTLPWVVTSVISDATTTSAAAGVEAFGLRSEPGLGPVGTVLSLGGIWNADAVPASRTMWWAAVATFCFLLVVAAGVVALWRRRGALDPLVRAIGILTVVVSILLVLSTFGPGRWLLEVAVEHIAGAGLLRDTQKFSALLVPGATLAVAAAVAAACRRVPSGFALAGVALLVVAPLPDLAWGAGGSVRPVAYPDDWAAVSAIVPDDQGSVALWPADTVRHYRFADGVSLDPAARMLRAPVIESGALTVDGEVVDPPSEHAAAVASALEAGGSPEDLAALGVGWVLVENNSPPARLAADARLAHDGDDLRLYRVDDPADRGAGAADRTMAIAAHLLWAAMLGTGVVGAIVVSARERRRTSR
ncbi:hypothetical protein [Gordonia alkanivorans]|uniref:Glycosyltransferase RgtA/B/C/D-like domain-containing protein n=1 Tax=Gordonia alkanivorans NBRC 16433 TaxID=1027371 RepID=F9VQN5_9ACTN|nr:hypothetical protein [Gordonia alkanivorans]MDH3008188.1 hypothetical protein [Gordonia alkanivorans]MDH3017130.1 hypothetical protein [Gordonia alkanivorans]MDH3042375.1 hypothetical protein [Gordonia alkanivorans]GAA10924.1 hypothetical protein GOALK_016_00470 [Gordonia alkanivorans NBRC 16433]